MAPPEELPDDLVGEFFLRLPPEDPACLLRASLACKRWRRVLADPAFRRRHSAVHPAPSVLGFIRPVSGRGPYFSSYVPLDPDSRGPGSRDLPGLVLDCRHGRALLVAPAAAAAGPWQRAGEGPLEFMVWDPLTNLHLRLPPPPLMLTTSSRNFNAAVLCDAAGTEGCCDHRGCHLGHIRVAFVWSLRTSEYATCTRACVYSSATGRWSNLTSVHSNFSVDGGPRPSALVGDTVYFCASDKHAFAYQLSTRHLSIIDKPPETFRGDYIFLLSPQGDGLGFVGLERDETNLRLSMWSRETSPDGVAQWIRGRDIELEILLPHGVLQEQLLYLPRMAASLESLLVRVVGFAEGTDVLFLSPFPFNLDLMIDVYMVQFNSGSAKKVLKEFTSYLFPYTSFCVPVTNAPSAGEEPSEN